MTKAKEITGAEPMLTIPQAEPIGPKGLLDLLIFNAVYGKQHCEAGQWDYGHSCADGCKAHLRNERPLLVSISTNDALGMNMKNIGLLLTLSMFILYRLNRIIRRKAKFDDRQPGVSDPGGRGGTGRQTVSTDHSVEKGKTMGTFTGFCSSEYGICTGTLCGRNRTCTSRLH